MAEAAKKRGRQVPAVVQRAPTLPPSDVFWWSAYWDLCHERSNITGLIPPMRIMEYADRFGVPYWKLRAVVDAMDTKGS